MHMKLYKTLTRCEAEYSVSIHSSDRPYVYFVYNRSIHLDGGIKSSQQYTHR